MRNHTAYRKSICLPMTARQAAFLSSTAFETLFGGAAGGGKSHGQLLDALRIAVQHPHSRQLLLRRSFPELERSLIPASLRLFPQRVASYHVSSHTWRFQNGSTLEFGCCDAESDVTKYQSAEYDVLRFDELTHFTQAQFTYLISRVRGLNPCPKQVKSTTNPGGIGHHWVKARYIDPMPPNTLTNFDGGSRLFLPARLQDNPYLQRADAGYETRLRLLSPHDRRALLEGEWELNEGRYFTEWSERLHITSAHFIPNDWQRWMSIDYGLDMLAALWIALAPNGRCVVYREVYESGLVISQAAQRILAAEQQEEQIDCRLAPPDLWGRRQETGRSAVELFAEHGLYFQRSGNNRVAGWLALHELLLPKQNNLPRLQIFPCCRNLIRTLPALRHDRQNPSDVSSTPHELTHAPDALRGFAATVQELPDAAISSGYDSDISAFLQF